jgi:hypothetical protein
MAMLSGAAVLAVVVLWFVAVFVGQLLSFMQMGT